VGACLIFTASGDALFDQHCSQVVLHVWPGPKHGGPRAGCDIKRTQNVLSHKAFGDANGSTLAADFGLLQANGCCALTLIGRHVCTDLARRARGLGCVRALEIPRQPHALRLDLAVQLVRCMSSSSHMLVAPGFSNRHDFLDGRTTPIDQRRTGQFA